MAKITTMKDYIDILRQLWHIIVIEKKLMSNDFYYSKEVMEVR